MLADVGRARHPDRARDLRGDVRQDVAVEVRRDDHVEPLGLVGVQRERDIAVRRGEVQRVIQQIGHGLREALTVAVHVDGMIVGKLQVDLSDGGAPLASLHQLLYQCRKVERLCMD